MGKTLDCQKEEDEKRSEEEAVPWQIACGFTRLYRVHQSFLAIEEVVLAGYRNAVFHICDFP